MAAGLREFRGVRRRMQLRGTAAGVAVYDDFAHHPTAIARDARRRALGLSRIGASGRSSSRARRRRAGGSSRRISRGRFGEGRSRHPAGRVPIDAARGRAAVGRGARRGPARPPAVDARYIPRGRRHRPARVASEARERRSRRRHVERRLRRHPPEAADGARGARGRVQMHARSANRPRRRCGAAGRAAGADRSRDQRPGRRARARGPRPVRRARSATSSSAIARSRCTSIRCRWMRRGWSRRCARSPRDCRSRRPTRDALIDVPVCYGGDVRPGSRRRRGVRAAARSDEVIALHSGVDVPRLSSSGSCRASPTWRASIRGSPLPRRTTPRTRGAGRIGGDRGRPDRRSTRAKRPAAGTSSAARRVKPYDRRRARSRSSFSPGDRVRFPSRSEYGA